MKYALINPEGKVVNISAGVPGIASGWTVVPFAPGAEIGGTWDGTQFHPKDTTLPPDEMRRIPLRTVYERLTDSEQDTLIDATAAIAKRVRYGIQADVSVSIDRVRPFLVSAFGAGRASEILDRE